MNSQPTGYEGVWRHPPQQSDYYPKLMVADNVVTGSINIRGTRLPLWAIVSTAIEHGWDSVESGWELEKHYGGFSKQDFSHFLYCLLEQRGEFGRLLLLLADVERLDNDDDNNNDDNAWWENANSRQKIMLQLRNCLSALEQIDT